MFRTTLLAAALAAGHYVIDVRTTPEFGTGHAAGTLNIPINKSFPTYAGSIIPFDQPIDIVAPDEAAMRRTVRELVLIGFSEFRHWFPAAVLEAWRAEGRAMGTIARTDVATCTPEERVGELVDRPSDGMPMVVLGDGVVVGVVRSEVLDLPPELVVRDVMQTAPPSVRPSITAAELAKSMDRDGQRWVLVTHLDGTLVGVTCREELDGQH